MELRLFVRVLFAFAIVSVALSDSVLKISGGNITTIRKDLIPPIVSDIDFSNNIVDTVVAEAFSSEFITSLDLSNNKLPQLNAEWFGMNGSNLVNLTLSHNEIITVESEFFSKATKLLDIDLSYNQLHSINLTNAPKLEKLNLSHNQLNDTESIQLMNLTHLTHLDLSSNPLKQVNRAIFGELKELQLLNLSGTSLTEIKPDTFENQVNLSILDLSNNNFTNLNASVFESLAGLKEIHVDKMFPPISCSYNHSLGNVTIFFADGQTAKPNCSNKTATENTTSSSPEASTQAPTTDSTQVSPPTKTSSSDGYSVWSLLGCVLLTSFIAFGGIFVYRKYFPNRSRPSGGRFRYNNMDESGNDFLINDL